MLIRLQVFFCRFYSLFLYKFITEKSMLRGDLCRGILSLSSANLISLEDNSADSCLLKPPCSQYAGYTAADHSCFCVDITIQRGIFLSVICFHPYGFHFLPPVSF